MAATDRLGASDITLATAGSSVVDKMRALDNSVDPARVDHTCIGDTYATEKPGTKKKEISLEAAIETTGVWRALVGTNVTFSHDLAGTSETGTGYLFGLRESSGGINGAQTEVAVISVHTVD
ncbi:MAG TPA: hypothetical protein VM223_23835 [Planctomycetota bacterium]|nr:hypothetical protein [Planctomycetota bacterium]